MAGLETCCVEGCTLRPTWRMIWYTQPVVPENPGVDRERIVCDSDAHILMQRSPRYPDMITNVETGLDSSSLIEDRADLYKMMV